MGRNPLHPGILDAEFLSEEGQFVVQAVDLSTEAGPSTPLVGGPRQHGRAGVVD